MAIVHISYTDDEIDLHVAIHRRLAALMAAVRLGRISRKVMYRCQADLVTRRIRAGHWIFVSRASMSINTRSYLTRSGLLGIRNGYTEKFYTVFQGFRSE